MKLDTQKLGIVQETLFIPLYARAIESKKNSFFYDPKAIEILNQLGDLYDFEKFKNKRTLFTNVYRTFLFDLWVKEFIEKYPSSTVIELGCGLNSRFERLDNGKIHWIDLDLSDVMEIRKMFFKETERRKMIDASVTEREWMDFTKKQFPPPYFFVAEAVLIYLEKNDVEKFFRNLNQNFLNTNSCLAFDSGGDSLIQFQHTHDILKFMKAKLKWALTDFNEIRNWAPNLELKETRLLLDLPQDLKKNLKLIHRILYPLYNRIYLKWALDYRLNLFCIK